MKSRLIAVFGPAGRSALSVTEIDVSSAQPADVFDLLREIPLFADERSIVFDNAEKLLNEKTYPGFDKLLFDPEDPSLIILLMSQPARTLESKAIVKECLRQGRAAYFYAPRNDAETVRWARNHCSRRGISITEEAASLLVSMTGTNISELAQELAKLEYVVSGGNSGSDERRGETITAAIVEEYVAPHRESIPYEWADALIERDARAIEISAVTTDHGRMAIPAIAAVNSRFTDIERWRNNEPIPPFRRAAVQRMARMWSESAIVAARQLLLRLDLDLKSRPSETHLARVELAAAELLEL